jgi:hypothetical protein
MILIWDTDTQAVFQPSEFPKLPLYFFWLKWCGKIYVWDYLVQIRCLKTRSNKKLALFTHEKLDLLW